MKGQGKHVLVYKKTSGEVLSKLKSRGFLAPSVSTFSTPYTTFPHGLNPGENDGQMTMEYHGITWSTMVVHGHTTMVSHGCSWSTTFC